MTLLERVTRRQKGSVWYQYLRMANTSDAGSKPALVELTEDDIPGAALAEPLESHTVPALKWWLL